MTTERIIAVVGATGRQGGGLVRAILANPGLGFRARAITRDPSSEQAREFARLGAEVVAGDLDDASSIKRAFEGAYGAYCVTFFWNHFSPTKELEHAQVMARAAKATGVRHVIWSTLEDTRIWVPLDDDRMPTLSGGYKVPHCDCKGAANRFFAGIEVPTTFLHTSFYWENFINFGMGPAKGPDGRYAITFPMGAKKLPGIGASDIGASALGVFREGERYVGKFVGVAGEHLTGAQMAAAFTKALGVDVHYQDVPPDVYRNFGFQGAVDLGNMFQFKRDFEQVFCGLRDVDLCRRLNPTLQSFETWLERNKASIRLA